MAKLLSVMFSDDAVRVVVGESSAHRSEGGSAFAVEKSLVFPLPPGLYANDTVLDAPRLGRLIGEQLARHHVHVKTAIFAVSSSKTVARNVTMPNMSRKKLDTAVALNASEYFPMDLTDCRVVYDITGKEPDGKLRLQVFAIAKTLVDSYAAVASAAGLRLKSVDYAPNARFNYYRTLRLEGTRVMVYVDHAATHIMVVRNGIEMFFRTLLFGANELLEEYRTRANLPKENLFDAGALLTAPDAAANGIRAGMTTADVHTLLDRVSAGIGHSVRFYIGNADVEQVDDIILTGPLRHLWHLRESVAREVNCPVRTLDEITAATTGVRTADVRDVLSCITAVGAPIRPLGIISSESIREHRKSRRLKRRAQAQKSLTGAVTILIIALAGSAAIIAVPFLELRFGLNEQKTIIADIDALADTAEAYAQHAALEESLSVLRGRDEVVKGVNAELAMFFEELETKLPTAVFLQSAVCDEDGITLGFKAPTEADVAQTLIDIRGFASLPVLSINAVTYPQGNEAFTAGVDGFVFTVNCLYAAPQSMPAPTGDLLLDATAETKEDVR